MASKKCEDIILNDGYPAMKGHPWTWEKHERLRKYVDISSSVRRKFLNGPSHTATYIDLFCGPGKAHIPETDEVIDGSPLVACDSAAKSSTLFSEFHLADTNSIYLEAVEKRLLAKGANVNIYHGDAETQIDIIVNNLNPYGLNFAFLDPFALSPLPFSIIEKLCKFKYIDLLIHVSVYDLQVNYKKLITSGNPILDNFAPGWREHVQLKSNQQAVRIDIVNYWASLMEKSGVEKADGAELVRGEQNQNLYWLVFASGHELARKFWKEIKNIHKQNELGF